MNVDDYYRALTHIPALAGLPDSMFRQFAKLAGMVADANRRTNLTRIIEPEAMATSHFADSLAVFDAHPEIRNAQVGADLGSGAGFPVLPLAIALPDCTWFAVESARKKCEFIKTAVRELYLPNVIVEWTRAEEFARGPQRETCNVVTARAVGAVPALCEVGLPLLRIGGSLLLHKTANAAAELQSAGRTIATLGGAAREPHTYAFKGDTQQRAIYVIEKIRMTPDEYPRAAGTPFKRPL
jgi:16S rRNA (guanine527-N7)-methyltransferase